MKEQKLKHSGVQGLTGAYSRSFSLFYLVLALFQKAVLKRFCRLCSALCCIYLPSNCIAAFIFLLFNRDTRISKGTSVMTVEFWLRVCLIHPHHSHHTQSPLNPLNSLNTTNPQTLNPDTQTRNPSSSEASPAGRSCRIGSIRSSSRQCGGLGLRAQGLGRFRV